MRLKPTWKCNSTKILRSRLGFRALLKWKAALLYICCFPTSQGILVCCYKFGSRLLGDKESHFGGIICRILTIVA